MTRPLHIAPEAFDDLARILDWIGEHNPSAALDQVDQILDAIEGLQAYPHRGRKGRVRGTRELVVTGTAYLVFYRVTQTRVLVLHVQHGKQRWPRR